MKEYELIWEIFNKCPRNQMRDVFVEELELECRRICTFLRYQW